MYDLNAVQQLKAETHIELKLGVIGFDTEILPISHLTGDALIQQSHTYIEELVYYAALHGLPIHYSRSDLGEAHSRSLFANAAKANVTLVERA